MRMLWTFTIKNNSKSQLRNVEERVRGKERTEKKLLAKIFGAHIESWSHANDTVVNSSIASNSLCQFEYQTK